MSKVEKVRQLIAMALNEATAPEEARSFAFAAVSLIASERIELRDPALINPNRVLLQDLLDRGDERLEKRRWPEAGPTPRARPVARKPDDHVAAGSDRMITSKAAGYCAVCRDAFPKGERVVFRPATQDLAHAACHTSDRAPEPPPG